MGIDTNAVSQYKIDLQFKLTAKIRIGICNSRATCAAISVKSVSIRQSMS